MQQVVVQVRDGDVSIEDAIRHNDHQILPGETAAIAFSDGTVLQIASVPTPIGEDEEEEDVFRIIKLFAGSSAVTVTEADLAAGERSDRARLESADGRLTWAIVADAAGLAQVG